VLVPVLVPVLVLVLVLVLRPLCRPPPLGVPMCACPRARGATHTATMTRLLSRR
jgi:hypothetical protein